MATRDSSAHHSGNTLSERDRIQHIISPVLRGARRPCAGKVEQRPSVVGNQNGEHLNGDQFFQNRFRRETRAPLVDEHS